MQQQQVVFFLLFNGLFGELLCYSIADVFKTFADVY